MKNAKSVFDKEALKAQKQNKRRKRKNHMIIAIATVLCTSLALVFLAPIVLTITNSFMSKTEIEWNYGSVLSSGVKRSEQVIASKVNLKFLPDQVTLKQYNEVLFKNPDYLIKFWNSVILTLPIVIFQILVSMGAAYGLSRHRSKWKEVVFFIYIVMMLMPYQVTLVPNYLVADKLNILNSNWAIWLPGIFSPFAVYMLTKYIRRIPTSLIEAAQIDGCGEWKIFWKIAFPLSKGSMMAVGILLFIDYWNMVEQPVILIADQIKHPLSVFLSKINTNDVGLAFAVATIYLFMPLFVFLYGEESLVEGITFQGGVKG